MNFRVRKPSGMPLFDYAFANGAAPTPEPKRFRSVELFAGAGGLGMGLARAGFDHEIVVERDSDACATLRHNKSRGHNLVREWNVVEADVRNADLSAVAAGIDLLSGGPPCQPFSIGGRHAGSFDSRDMWPWTVEATRKLQPRGFLFENVRNLASPTFKPYLDYVLLQLSYPELLIASGETIESHADRLGRYHIEGKPSGLWYRTKSYVANAADHGVAQNRHRIFIVGVRSDNTTDWTAPAETHSVAALEHSKWISGAYFDRHSLARPEPDEATNKRLRMHNQKPPEGFNLKPHRTLRDAIGDLGEPDAINTRFRNHEPPPREARAYHGHTGSPLDLPAKAIRAGDHGVSGGENMIDFGNGAYRHFTAREAARLQDFDDEFEFPSVWSAALKQLGNAVPVGLSYTIGLSIAQTLN